MMALITMTTSSYLINYNHEIYKKFEHILQRFESEDKKDVDVKRYKDHAVVIGYNPVIKRLIPVIKQGYGNVVVIDKNSENTEELAKEDFEYIYGDFKHGEIRKAAGIKDAAFVLSVTGDEKANHHILRDTDRKTSVFLEAKNFEQAAELYDQGADYIMIENVLTADKIADYLELYIKDPSLFQEEIKDDLEAVYWGDRGKE